MALFFIKAWEGYQILFEDLPDPRTKQWLFVAKPYQVILVISLYLMFVLKWGPKFMENRPAFQLRNPLIFFDGFQVLASLYVFINGIYYGWGWDYKWICEPVDYSNNPMPIKAAELCYWYFMLKIMDLLDTVFFVMRKKYNQVSFLHLYHHAGMVLLIWANVTYLPGGHGTLVGVINSFVHVVMYSYYLITIVKPSVKNSLGWKKYITQLQILQFFWCLMHMAIIVFIPDCEYPRWTSAVFLPQNIFMLVLFIDFYIKAYIRKPKIQVEHKNGKSKVNGHNGTTKNGVNGKENGKHS